MGGQRRVILDIEAGTEPVSGRVTDHSGTRTFSGWLGLAAAINTALDATTQDGDDTTAAAPDPGRQQEGVAQPDSSATPGACERGRAP